MKFFFWILLSERIKEQNKDNNDNIKNKILDITNNPLRNLTLLKLKELDLLLQQIKKDNNNNNDNDNN